MASMKLREKPDASSTVKRRLAALGLVLALSVSAGARAEIIAGVVFDDSAFVDSVVSSFGSFGPSVHYPAGVGAGDATAIIGANVDTFAHSFTTGAYIEIGFTDNAIVNGPGPDLGIFELGDIREPQFFTLSVADMLASTNVVQVDTAYTGYENGHGTRINYGTLDLSDLGVADGATVSSLVFTSVCDAGVATNTGGACIAGNRTMAGAVVIGALNSIDGLDPLEKYDNFNAKKTNGCKRCIDAQKWAGLQRGDYVTEIEREVKAKRLHMAHRSWGGVDSDDGTEQGRNRLRFKNSETFSGVCFTPRIRKYELRGCDANDDPGEVRIRYLGNFYDTDANDDGDDGVIYAGIELTRDGDSERKTSKFTVEGWATQCAGTDCDDPEPWSTYDDVDDPDLEFGSTQASTNKKAMCIGYDRFNHELVFSFGDDVRTVNAPDNGLPVFGSNLSASQTWHVIEAITDVPNCSARRSTGAIDGDFDDVKVRKRP